MFLIDMFLEMWRESVILGIGLAGAILSAFVIVIIRAIQLFYPSVEELTTHDIGDHEF